MVLFGYSVSMTVIWLILLAVFLMIEIITLGLTTIWFAGGSLVSAISAMLGAPEWIQIILFVAVSFILMLSVRPMAKKYLNQSRKQTNLDSLINCEAKVIERIDNFQQSGKVILKGMEWTARTEDNRVVEPGEKVKVVSISGVKLIVI